MCSRGLVLGMSHTTFYRVHTVQLTSSLIAHSHNTRQIRMMVQRVLVSAQCQKVERCNDTRSRPSYGSYMLYIQSSRFWIKVGPDVEKGNRQRVEQPRHFQGTSTPVNTSTGIS